MARWQDTDSATRQRHGAASSSGARGVATGASHSLAIRDDGSLWAWGSGFGVEPTKIADNVVAVAAGNGSTIALSGDGKLWAWDGGRGPRQIALDR
jgi:alpha-tubulin suppressor-like RCC1 family protein